MRYRHEYITTVCIDVRMAMEASSDPWDDEDYLETYHWLCWRYAHWVDYRPYEREFDECVKRMVKITIDAMGSLPCVINEAKENARLAKLSVGT